MKEFWNIIQAGFTVVGGWLGYFIGGWDGLIYALLTFVVSDYLTGVMCAVYGHRLSSSVGFKGLCHNTLVFVMVGVGHILNTQILGETGVLSTAIIFFYMSNWRLPLVENASYLGLPIPEKLRAVLEQLHANSRGKDKNGQ